MKSIYQKIIGMSAAFVLCICIFLSAAAATETENEKETVLSAIEKKYSGYINRQKAQVEKAKKMSEKRIPETFDYNKIPSLLTETRQKLNKVRPATLGQASRVSGVTPADMAIILIYLQKGK